jgi:hypothetical protein
MNIYLKFKFIKVNKPSNLFPIIKRTMCTNKNNYSNTNNENNENENHNSIEIKEERKYYPIVSQVQGPEAWYFGIRYLLYYPLTLFTTYKGIVNLFAEYYVWAIFYGLSTLFLTRLLKVHKMGAYVLIRDAGIVKENGKAMLQLSLFSGDVNSYELGSITEADSSKLTFRINPKNRWIMVNNHFFVFPKKVKIEDEEMLVALTKGTIKEYLELNNKI